MCVTMWNIMYEMIKGDEEIIQQYVCDNIEDCFYCDLALSF